MISHKRNALLSAVGVSLSFASLIATPEQQAPKALTTTSAMDKQIVSGKNLTVRYVDSLGAMRESKDGQIVAVDLESKRNKMTTELQQLEQKLMQLAKEFQEKASMMSEDAREKEQKRLVKMERDFKIKAQEYEEDFKVSMQKATEKLSKEVDDAVYQYARSNKIDVVVDKWTGRVIYSAQENEPTGEIVALMNQSHEKRVALENTKKPAASTTVAATKTENKAHKA